MSGTKTLSDGLTTALISAFAWDTPPEAGWYFDGTRPEVEGNGLTAVVLGTGRPLEAFRRGGPLARNEIMVAVYAPVDNDVAEYADGDATVARAEAVADWLWDRKIGDRNCVEVDHGPLISQEFLREHRLWVSIIKTVWR